MPLFVIVLIVRDVHHVAVVLALWPRVEVFSILFLQLLRLLGFSLSFFLLESPQFIPRFDELLIELLSLSDFFLSFFCSFFELCLLLKDFIVFLSALLELKSQSLDLILRCLPLGLRLSKNVIDSIFGKLIVINLPLCIVTERFKILLDCLDCNVLSRDLFG